MAFALQHHVRMQPTIPHMPPAATEELVAEKRKLRGWLELISARFRIGIPTIATRSKISPSTLYRWIDEESPVGPSLQNIRKIAATFEMPYPDDNNGHALTSFMEGEASVILPEDQPAELKAVANQGVWRLNTRALELAGYMPGDFILVDMTATPRNGDVVCAQIYDFQRGSAETKFRIYEPPFLTTRTMDAASSEAPLLVDGERTIVAGVVVRSLRIRIS